MSFSRDVKKIAINLVDVNEAIRGIKETQKSCDDMLIRMKMKRKLMIMMKEFINMGKSYYNACEFIHNDEQEQYEQEQYEQEQDEQDKYQEGDSDNEIIDWY